MKFASDYITAAEAVALYNGALSGEAQKAAQICHSLQEDFQKAGEVPGFLDYIWCVFHAGVIAGKREATSLKGGEEQ